MLTVRSLSGGDRAKLNCKSLEGVSTIGDECSQVGWRLLPFQAHCILRDDDSQSNLKKIRSNGYRLFYRENSELLLS